MKLFYLLIFDNSVSSYSNVWSGYATDFVFVEGSAGLFELICGDSESD